jgi:hypothetical protein
MIATGRGKDSIDYMTIPYRHVTQILGKVDMSEDCVSLDYGSGMGQGHPTRVRYYNHLRRWVYSIWKMAIPVLEELKLPGTVYVTTYYYCLKGNPIFWLVIQCMLWKTIAAEVHLQDLGLPETGVARFPDARTRDEVAWQIISYAESQMDEGQRVRLCEELGRRLNVDYARIIENRFLTLMSTEQIRKAAQKGVDIQPHTHQIAHSIISAIQAVSTTRTTDAPWLKRK